MIEIEQQAEKKEEKDEKKSPSLYHQFLLCNPNYVTIV